MSPGWYPRFRSFVYKKHIINSTSLGKVFPKGSKRQNVEIRDCQNQYWTHLEGSIPLCVDWTSTRSVTNIREPPLRLGCTQKRAKLKIPTQIIRNSRPAQRDLSRDIQVEMIWIWNITQAAYWTNSTNNPYDQLIVVAEISWFEVWQEKTETFLGFCSY